MEIMEVKLLKIGTEEHKLLCIVHAYTLKLWYDSCIDAQVVAYEHYPTYKLENSL